MVLRPSLGVQMGALVPSLCKEGHTPCWGRSGLRHSLRVRRTHGDGETESGKGKVTSSVPRTRIPTVTSSISIFGGTMES